MVEKTYAGFRSGDRREVWEFPDDGLNPFDKCECTGWFCLITWVASVQRGWGEGRRAVETAGGSARGSLLKGYNSGYKPDIYIKLHSLELVECLLGNWGWNQMEGWGLSAIEYFPSRPTNQPNNTHSEGINLGHSNLRTTFALEVVLLHLKLLFFHYELCRCLPFLCISQQACTEWCLKPPACHLLLTFHFYFP